MPYIKQEDRDRITESIKGSAYLSEIGEGCKTSGELNYALTEILIGYMDREGQSYQTFNDIVGALECCKSEFVRRIVNDYEDDKIKENGDVY